MLVYDWPDAQTVHFVVCLGMRAVSGTAGALLIIEAAAT